MHDRQIDGKTYVFGNHGALWMNAMTWYDHETESIWSQPWGRALTGPLKGTQLKLLPYNLVPWGSWKANHPNTLALVVDEYARRVTPRDNFVLGVAIGDVARAYYYEDTADQIIINDVLNGIPIVVHTNPKTRVSHIFIRQLSDGTILNFTGDAETMTDDVTNSIWTPVRGLATDGELVGTGIREIPYISSYDWAWIDFYPHTNFWGD